MRDDPSIKDHPLTWSAMAMIRALIDNPNDRTTALAMLDALEESGCPRHVGKRIGWLVMRPYRMADQVIRAVNALTGPQLSASRLRRAIRQTVPTCLADTPIIVVAENEPPRLNVQPDTALSIHLVTHGYRDRPPGSYPYTHADPAQWWITVGAPWVCREIRRQERTARPRDYTRSFEYRRQQQRRTNRGASNEQK